MVLNISEVNALNVEQFSWIFGNVIELCTEASHWVIEKRPFSNAEDLCKAYEEYLDSLPEDGKINVLRLHPDLAGRLAEKGQLTSESTKEQKSAGLEEMTEEQKSLIDYYNKCYNEKFGFPFIICARENQIPSIIESLMRRYNNTQIHEITIGINEVKKICRLRILDLVWTD